MARERTTAWSPRAIPFGFLIALLGAWVDRRRADRAGLQLRVLQRHQLELLHEAVGNAADPRHVANPRRPDADDAGARRRRSRPPAFAAGAWLIIYPLWSSGSIEPYGTEGMKALRWIGHFYGPGGLILFFAGYAYGLFARRTVVQDTEVAAEPHRQRTVTAGT